MTKYFVYVRADDMSIETIGVIEKDNVEDVFVEALRRSNWKGWYNAEFHFGSEKATREYLEEWKKDNNDTYEAIKLFDQIPQFVVDNCNSGAICAIPVGAFRRFYDKLVET